MKRSLPADEQLRDDLPLIAVLLMRLEEPVLVLLLPDGVIDLGVEVIVPPESRVRYL
jgi:hypothetical protein